MITTLDLLVGTERKQDNTICLDLIPYNEKKANASYFPSRISEVFDQIEQASLFPSACLLSVVGQLVWGNKNARKSGRIWFYDIFLLLICTKNPIS